MGFEIEKKYLVKALPADAERFPYREITQGYLCRHPAVRVRRDALSVQTAEGGAPEEHFYMTYKGLRRQDTLAQEEYNLDLTREAYEHLLDKADGIVIEKKRILIPLNADAFPEGSEGARCVSGGDAVIELDIFAGALAGLVIAEVEFPSEEIAAAYRPAAWFGEEVTGDERYSNAYLAFHTTQ